MAPKKKEAEATVVITPPKFRTAEFEIKGVAPYVQLRFSQKTQEKMLKDMAAGSLTKKGKKREGRDYKQEFKDAMYEATAGWRGIPATCFRAAMVSACRTVGFKMTLAKLSVFIEADGFDKEDGTPLVKIVGKPKLVQHGVTNANGGRDIRTRAMWETWKAKVRIRYDADQFSQDDVANLLMRVGLQVGIGEGRPDGKKGTGMGWGLFEI